MSKRTSKIKYKIYIYRLVQYSSFNYLTKVVLVYINFLNTNKQTANFRFSFLTHLGAPDCVDPLIVTYLVVIAEISMFVFFA